MNDVYVLYQIIGEQMFIYERYDTRAAAVAAAKREFKQARWAIVLERVVARSKEP